MYQVLFLLNVCGRQPSPTRPRSSRVFLLPRSFTSLASRLPGRSENPDWIVALAGLGAPIPALNPAKFPVLPGRHTCFYGPGRTGLMTPDSAHLYILVFRLKKKSNLSSLRWTYKGIVLKRGSCVATSKDNLALRASF